MSIGNSNKLAPPGTDPYLAPYGGWKIISFKSFGDEMTADYRCVYCRAISSEKSDVCPNCKRNMKGDSSQHENQS